MKAQTKVITAPDTVTEIDWSKPQYMITEEGHIVLSTGKHEGAAFEGICLKHKRYNTGNFNSMWGKKWFTPITTPITIEISNTND